MKKDPNTPATEPAPRRYPVPDPEETDVARSPTRDELPLPHERDEAPDPAAAPPRPEIEQAARDIQRGLRDTDRHGVPSDVPGPGESPERTTGADVPVDAPSGAAHGPRKSERWR